MEDFDLREMVEGVAEGVASSAQATGVSVACSFARDVQAARRGDRECVEEILTELLASASSSTKEGYVIVRVDGPGPGDATDDVIVITVEDTGDGSNPAVLASVEKLIHRVGGTIWLEHPAEKGTKVRCSFPLAHARVAAPSPSVDELAESARLSFTDRLSSPRRSWRCSPISGSTPSLKTTRLSRWGVTSSATSRTKPSLLAR